MSLKNSENNIIWTVTFGNCWAPFLLVGPDEIWKCKYARWRGSAPLLHLTWHVRPLHLKWAGCISDAVFSFCIVVRQCHEMIPSSTKKWGVTHFPYSSLWVETADPRAGAAAAWDGEGALETQCGLSQETLMVIQIYRKHMACAGTQL